MPGRNAAQRGARPKSANSLAYVPDFSDDTTLSAPPHPLRRSAGRRMDAPARVPQADRKSADSGKPPAKPNGLHRTATGERPAHDPAPTRSAATPAPAGPQLDGQGLPYQTLAQLLKQHGLADTGGSAKHLVRAGGITVNGAEELRPGRKLHHGDVVVIGNQTLKLVIIPA